MIFLQGKVVWLENYGHLAFKDFMRPNKKMGAFTCLEKNGTVGRDFKKILSTKSNNWSIKSNKLFLRKFPSCKSHKNKWLSKMNRFTVYDLSSDDVFRV